MNYTQIRPCGELKDFVSHFWVGTWDIQAQTANDVYYVIANSLSEITFAFSGAGKHDALLFSIVQGHTQKPMQFPVDGFYHLIGVSLYSYAIPALFGLPSFDINQAFIPLTDFLGREGAFLNERMAQAETTEQRIALLSMFLKGLLKNQKPVDGLMIKAIKEVKRQEGTAKVLDLASNSFLSQKQFNRRFKEFSGFNPKVYARVVRMESAIKSYPDFQNLTALAHHKGYYDQAHFTREFKEFTGFTPKQFWKLSEDKA